MFRLIFLTALITLPHAYARMRFSPTNITSTFSSENSLITSLSTSFDGTKISYGYGFEIYTIQDLLLYTLDIHTKSKVTESIQVRIKTSTSDDFNSSTSSWTLVSNATDVAGEEIDEGYRTSIPLNDFSPTPLSKDSRYSIYISLTTATLLSTMSYDEEDVIAEDMSALQILDGFIVAEYPSTATRGGFHWDGAIHYKLADTIEPTGPPEPRVSSLPDEEFATEAAVEKRPTPRPTPRPTSAPTPKPSPEAVSIDSFTKTMISFSYKAPHMPIDTQQKMKIDNAIKGMLNDSLQSQGISRRINVQSITSIFTEDLDTCSKCYVITSVATISHDASISNKEAEASIALVAPQITINVPALNYTQPRLLNANLLFVLQGSSEIAEYELETNNVEEAFLLLFEEVMVEFLNAKLMSMTPPAHIISVNVRDPNIFEESSARSRLRSADVQTQELNDLRLSTEYMYNLDTIITGEFILYPEEYFERLTHDIASDYANSFVRMLDQKLEESKIPVRVEKMKSIQSSYIGEDREKRKEESKRYWLYFLTIIISFLVYSVKCPGT